MNKSRMWSLLIAFIFSLPLWVLPVGAQHSISTPAGPIYSYSHISTLTSITVKGSSGTLHSIIINGSGSSPCLVIVYDSISPSGNQVAAVDCSSSKQLNYDISFTNGLTIVTVSTAAPVPTAADVTVLYQ